MNRIRGFFARLRDEWGPYSEWPFMLFLTFVFAFIYLWTVTSSARVRDGLTLLMFTVLFNVHLGLHWLSVWWLQKKWSTWLYLGIQTAIVFTLVSMAGELGALVGLYVGLVGESVGLFNDSWRKKTLAVAAILVVSAVNYYWMLPESQILWWAAAILPLTVFVIMYVLLYSRQAEARIRAQELLAELETANRTLTEYADRIEDLTLTGERQRMARELHDTLAQGLAGLILQLEAVDSHLGQGHTDRAQAIVEQAMARARATLAESRRAIDGLRKETPESLEESIRDEVGHFTAATGVPCELAYAVEGPLPEGTPELALRTVSEGLTNIARHAQARHASVAIRIDGGALAVEISDDGIGFDPDDEREAGHYGLIGLRERVRQAGASLDIRSGEHDGTVIDLRIPLPGA
jgi:NarL family two-component system sensor histidine kinase YdfH